MNLLDYKPLAYIGTHYHWQLTEKTAVSKASRPWTLETTYYFINKLVLMGNFISSLVAFTMTHNSFA